MPLESSILPELGIVVTRASGSPSLDEIRSHQRTLEADPDFDPSHHHLFDLTEIKEIQLSTQEIRSLASVAIFSPSSRRAVVAPRDDAMKWLGGGEEEA